LTRFTVGSAALAGVLSDRIGSRPLLVSGMLLSALAIPGRGRRASRRELGPAGVTEAEPVEVAYNAGSTS